MRLVLGMILAAASLGWALASEAGQRPITGQAVEGFEKLDAIVLDYMDHVDASAGALAVSRGGALLYSRGYGYSDPAKREAARPEAMFRIASISKPITAAAVKRLIDDGRLQRETRVFTLLSLQPARLNGGRITDDRLRDITVDHLLHHKGGWDRDATFDPVFEDRDIAQKLRLHRPANATDLIRYMMVQTLQFTPGEREAYSNFGYVVLGRAVERAGKVPYDRYVTQNILAPIGCERMAMGRSGSRGRLPGEVVYPDRAYEVNLEAMDAAGGWVASAPDLCRFMGAYWLSGTPRRPWHLAHWHFFGSLPGTTAYADQRLDGYNLVLLVNNRRDDGYEADHDELRADFTAAVDAIRDVAMVGGAKPQAATAR